MKAHQCHVIPSPVIELSKPGDGQLKSGRKNQKHKHSKEQQVDATLQNICFATCKRDHAHRQC